MPLDLSWVVEVVVVAAVEVAAMVVEVVEVAVVAIRQLVKLGSFNFWVFWDWVLELAVLKSGCGDSDWNPDGIGDYASVDEMLMVLPDV
ncbi:hypothetical protein G9A89_013851 [Geosiphon pyriformis]|nr:hypothetical protein G9A89_013851 [Geosiphon pyriformis]